METAYGKSSNAETTETVSGEVISVGKMSFAKGMIYGVYVIVKTDEEKITVHLGPLWFIEDQEIKIQPKDQVEVKCLQIVYQGKPAIIASEVKRGKEILKLRDEDGCPCWNGRGSW
ncbi:MAG: DNA-binding protein [Smithella sp.]